MRHDNDDYHWDHGYHDQRLAGTLRSWPIDGAEDALRDSARSLLEVLDSVDTENGCFALGDIEAALRIDQLRQVINNSRVPVMAWCVRSTYDPEGFFNPGGTVVWAAFLTRKQARLWLPYFERKFKRRIENGDTFEVVRCPASLHRVYVDTADPDQENWVH